MNTIENSTAHLFLLKQSLSKKAAFAGKPYAACLSVSRIVAMHWLRAWRVFIPSRLVIGFAVGHWRL